MADHKCQFAELIGQSPEWQTDDDGVTVCKYCHASKQVLVEAIKTSSDKLVTRAAVTKTLRK